MTMYFKVIFWNVTKLKVWLFTKDILFLSGRYRALGGAISAQLYENAIDMHRAI